MGKIEEVKFSQLAVTGSENTDMIYALDTNGHLWVGTVSFPMSDEDSADVHWRWVEPPAEEQDEKSS